MESSNITTREAGLHKALTKRQITMIAIGGAIGTGLFMGSGIAIGYAGPAVLISYAIAALIAVIMVFSRPRWRWRIRRPARSAPTPRCT